MALNLSDKLFDILSHSIDWVKYAESKNGALIVLNTLIVVRLFFQLNQFYHFPKLLFIFSIGMFFFSIICCFISFIPVINYKSLNTSSKEVNSSETIYDLLLKKEDLNYSPEQWLILYCKQHEIDSSKIKKIDLVYAEQILIQKKIRFRKYRIFNISLFSLISGFFLLFVASMLQYN